MRIGLAQGLYMAEAEGFLNTRESAIQRVIRDIKHYDAAVMPEKDFIQTLKHNGIDPTSLTSRELRRIENAVRN